MNYYKSLRQNVWLNGFQFVGVSSFSRIETCDRAILLFSGLLILSVLVSKYKCFNFRKNVYTPQPVVRQSNFPTHVAQAMPVNTSNPPLHLHTHLDTNAFWINININFERNKWFFVGSLFLFYFVLLNLFTVPFFLSLFSTDVSQKLRFAKIKRFQPNEIWYSNRFWYTRCRFVDLFNFDEFHMWPCRCCQWRISISIQNRWNKQFFFLKIHLNDWSAELRYVSWQN